MLRARLAARLPAQWQRIAAPLIVMLVVMLLLATPALAAVIRTGILCDSGETYCVEAWNGMSLIMYSDAGSTQKFKVDGANGNINGAGWVNVSAPTAIASATPAVVINSAGVSNLLDLRKNATPVFQVNGAGNVTVAGTLNVTGITTLGGVKCYKGQQTVLGAATVIPATVTALGVTTPTWFNESFAASPGDTYWQSSHTNAAGVVTINVYQRMLSGTVTPQAATTSVALDYEICGN